MKIGQRALWHDYRGVGFYMLTMTVAGRRPLFGQVVEPGAMVLSAAGHQVLEAWRAMPSFKILYRKNRYKSANVTPASPMNTWTAERTFARNQLNFHLRGYPFRRPCIHG